MELQTNIADDDTVLSDTFCICVQPVAVVAGAALNFEPPEAYIRITKLLLVATEYESEALVADALLYDAWPLASITFAPMPVNETFIGAVPPDTVPVRAVP